MEPASLTTNSRVGPLLELERAMKYWIIVGTVAPITASSNSTIVEIIKLRWVTRDLYSRAVISAILQLDIILPPLGHLYTVHVIQPACLRIVVEFEAHNIATMLAFNLAHAALYKRLAFIDDDHILAHFFDLLQLVC